MPIVSIIIRTFNESKHIERLLRSIAIQKVDFETEIILVDSGSTDDTVAIASQYPINLVQIDPERFTFGYSLNRGIQAARGEFCVIVSAHCYPVSDQWLERLVAPLRQDSQVALVYGHQRGDNRTRYSEQQVFAQWFPDHNEDDCALIFCNNANSAIRREVWLSHPFDEKLPGLEDIAWGKVIRRAGFKICYRANAGVYHIHEETGSQIYRRYYREALAFKTIFKDRHFTFGQFLKFFVLNVGWDYFQALKDQQLLRNLADIPYFRLMQFWATYRAHAYQEPMSEALRQRLYYPKMKTNREGREESEENAKRVEQELLNNKKVRSF